MNRLRVGTHASGLRLRVPDLKPPAIFTIVSGEELWVRGSIVESRLMHGRAEQSGDMIVAVAARDAHLAQACDEALAVARGAVDALPEAQVRLRVRALRENDFQAVETTMTVALAGVSVVTTPSDSLRDYELLRSLVDAKPDAALQRLPLVWRNGSAAVLLHEAVGHALEHDVPPLDWPPWLSVDAPLRYRRETFRDVPLPRMTHLVASQNGAPFALPDQSIDIHLMAGGSYDPLTDMVTLDIAISSAGPFTLRSSRAEIAAALRGATGDPVRYPGVICSREGQALFVASHAPLLITGPLG